MANCLTAFRILCSIGLLFVKPFGAWFYCFYITAGITDMLDGFIARKLNSVSKFGEKLDTAADFVFVICAFVKILPLFEIPVWIYVWLSIIFTLKTITLLKKNPHTIMNKIMGLLLFLFPLLLNIIDFYFGVISLCSIAVITVVLDMRK